MASKIPLVINGGQIEQLQTGDILAGSGLFDRDINGDLEPGTGVQADIYYELDDSGDIMPKAV